MPTKKATTPDVDLPELARWVASETVVFTEDDSPFHATVTAGGTRLLVITGENASGKSLFFRILTHQVQDAGPLPVTVSIRERSGGGMRQAFMFGEEATQSTGAASINTVRAAFKNLDRTQGSMLGLDEPELGLSDGYAAALGTYIGQQAKSIPAQCAGVVVVTHNRALVRALLDEYGRAPTFVAVGHNLTLEEWIQEPETRTVEELLALPETSHTRFRWAAQATKRG